MEPDIKPLSNETIDTSSMESVALSVELTRENLEIDDELLNLCESTCQAMADAAEAASKEGSGYDSDAGSDASAPVVSSSSSKAASEDLASESEESETKSTH